MHGFVLSLKSKDILRALGPRLPILGVLVCKNMSNSLLELGNGLGIGIKVTSAVILAIKVTVALQSIVAVDGDKQLDAVAMGLCHEIVKPV